jgi:hypothetical protein
MDGIAGVSVVSVEGLGAWPGIRRPGESRATEALDASMGARSLGANPRGCCTGMHRARLDTAIEPDAPLDDASPVAPEALVSEEIPGLALRAPNPNVDVVCPHTERSAAVANRPSSLVPLRSDVP